MAAAVKPFATEAELVAAFCHIVERRNANERCPDDWAIYHETCGWDVLLADRVTGVQIGIEAKLTLNAKVIEQALPASDWFNTSGPDYRALLVPRGPSVQNHLGSIARHLGLGILALYDCRASWNGGHDPEWYIGDLPDEASSFGMHRWHSWLPAERCKLPDYVPDVMGGHASPVALTDWKIRAIKLMVILDRKGRVTRGDMKALEISPTRWTAAFHGFLEPSREMGGYVRCDRTPDLRAQHPRNYAEIEADWDTWAPPGYRFEDAAE